MNSYDEAIQTFQNLPSDRKDVYAELLAGERLPVIEFSDEDLQTIEAGRADIAAGRVVGQAEMEQVFAAYR